MKYTAAPDFELPLRMPFSKYLSFTRQFLVSNYVFENVYNQNNILVNEY